MAGLRRRSNPGELPLPFTAVESAPEGAVESAPQDAVEAAPDGAIGPATPFTVQVIRSGRRTRTSSARMVGETLEIRLPAWMSSAEEDRWVQEWSRRFRRKASTDRIDVRERAATLARRYDLPRPQSIRWVDDMRTRWGSCTPATGTIRLSSALVRFPDWVIDYVIVHELAHLQESGHSAAFWQLVERYPRTERARGYLMAKSADGNEDTW